MARTGGARKMCVTEKITLGRRFGRNLPLPVESANGDESVDLQFHALSRHGPKEVFADHGSLQQRRLDLAECDAAAVL